MSNPSNVPASAAGRQWLFFLVLMAGIAFGGYKLYEEIVSFPPVAGVQNPVAAAQVQPNSNPAVAPGATTPASEKQTASSEIDRLISEAFPAIQARSDANQAQDEFNGLERKVNSFLSQSRTGRHERLRASGVGEQDITNVERDIGSEATQRLDAARLKLPALTGGQLAPAGIGGGSKPIASAPDLAPDQFEILKRDIDNQNVVQQLAPFTTPGIFDTAQDRIIPDIDPKPVSYSAIVGCGALEPNIQGLTKVYELVTNRRDQIRPRWPHTHSTYELSQDLALRGRLQNLQQLLVKYGPALVKMKNLSQ